MEKRLLVIDGADQGRSFTLVETGLITLGKSGKYTNILVTDEAVAPLHCQLRIRAGRITVNAITDAAGTFINGQRVRDQELQPGDVLRVGNTHLRLEDDDLLEQEALAEEGGKLPTLFLERLHLLAGRMLGHYRLGGVLGRGHCGVVFGARDVKKDQPVALKVLAPDFPASEEEMQGFIRVMKARLTLQHPNLVSFLGVGKTGPYCWIALEYLDGPSVTERIEQARVAEGFEWRQAFRVAVDVSHVLDFLRQHRLVHGNITPQNLLIQRDDERTKLGDLMFFRALEGSVLQQSILEQKVLAELPYLAPEQVTPEATVDDLSDLYNLGAVVYALLTGRPPFEGDSPEEIIGQIHEEMPTRPRHYHDDIPEPFQVVVLKMLAKRPEERYSAPGELLAELERIGAEN
jgi:serine/threonine protein kinase